jgi:hypothetical protein
VCSSSSADDATALRESKHGAVSHSESRLRRPADMVGLNIRTEVTDKALVEDETASPRNPNVVDSEKSIVAYFVVLSI